MALHVTTTTDPSKAMEACAAHLEADPVAANVALTILRERVAHPEEGRYWWLTEDGTVTAYAWHAPATFKAGMTGSPAGARALAEAVFDVEPSCPGIVGEAGAAAVFAGHWTEIAAMGAVPEDGQRIYRLDEVRPVPISAGGVRVATADDIDQLIEWSHRFKEDTGTHSAPEEIETRVGRRVAAGWLWIWDDEGSAAMVTVIPPVAGVARISFVFTPAERRRAGYAMSAVAVLSEQALAGGASACTLYAQLANATSNGVYRRIGYRSVAEVLAYSFRP